MINPPENKGVSSSHDTPFILFIFYRHYIVTQGKLWYTIPD